MAHVLEMCTFNGTAVYPKAKLPETMKVPNRFAICHVGNLSCRKFQIMLTRRELTLWIMCWKHVIFVIVDIWGRG